MRALQNRVRLAPVTTTIIAACTAIFVVQIVLKPTWQETLLWWGGLSGQGLMLGMWWTLLTHLFLHGNLMHLLVNMLGLWFIGPEVELMLGRVRYATLYFLSGIAGGLLQTAFTPAASELVGASGALCGVLLSFVTANPEVRLQALLLFIIPVRMKAKTLGIILVGFSFLAAVISFLPWVGHLAHLGGALTGAFLTWWWKPANPHRKTEKTHHSLSGRAPHKEIEQLLEKVVSEGLENLTREERRVLEQLAKQRKTK